MNMQNIISSDCRISNDYLSILNKYKILSAEEEYAHALKLYEGDDRNSAEVLVLSNLRGVLYIARQYNGYGLPYQDLVQEGIVGLMRAVKRFDPYRNVRLFIYSLPWIKSEIQSYIVKNWKLVKVATTDVRKKLFFSLRTLKNKLMPIGPLNLNAAAEALSINKDDLLAVDNYFTSTDLTIDDNEYLQFADSIEKQPDMEVLQTEYNTKLAEIVPNVLTKLDDRSRDIIMSRYMYTPPNTLSELADKWNISIERVRQIEKKALSNLRKELPYFE